jgi:hypothetical protein
MAIKDRGVERAERFFRDGSRIEISILATLINRPNNAKSTTVFLNILDKLDSIPFFLLGPKKTIAGKTSPNANRLCMAINKLRREKLLGPNNVSPNGKPKNIILPNTQHIKTVEERP